MSGAPNMQGGISGSVAGRALRNRSGLQRGMPAPDTIDAEWASQNPEAAQAKLIETQRADFNARYRPLEESAIAEYMRNPELAAQRAGDVVTNGFRGGDGAVHRSMGRMGAQMTGDQQRAAGNATGLAQARAIGTAENTTRRSIADRNIEGMGTMIGIGKGLQGSTSSDLGAAAGMQNAREAAHKQAKSAHKANMVGTGVAVAGLAIAF